MEYYVFFVTKSFSRNGEIDGTENSPLLFITHLTMQSYFFKFLNHCRIFFMGIFKFSSLSIYPHLLSP